MKIYLNFAVSGIVIGELLREEYLSSEGYVKCTSINKKDVIKYCKLLL